MSLPIRKKRLYDNAGGGMASYNGKDTSEEKSMDKSEPSKPTTDRFGESLNRKNWKGTSGRKDWK